MSCSTFFSPSPSHLVPLLSWLILYCRFCPRSPVCVLLTSVCPICIPFRSPIPFVLVYSPPPPHLFVHLQLCPTSPSFVSHPLTPPSPAQLPVCPSPLVFVPCHCEVVPSRPRLSLFTSVCPTPPLFVPEQHQTKTLRVRPFGLPFCACVYVHALLSDTNLV